MQAFNFADELTCVGKSNDIVRVVVSVVVASASVVVSSTALVSCRCCRHDIDDIDICFEHQYFSFRFL